MASLTEDKESQYYRDLKPFDIDSFLMSKQISELVMMKSDAEHKSVRFVKND